LAAPTNVAATSVTLLAVGTCSVAADQPGDALYQPAPRITQSFAVTAALLTQTITFQPIGPQQLATGTLIAVATATSGLPVTFTSLSTGTCTVSGAQLSFLAAGTCTLRASQPGDQTYAAAPDVQQSFQIGSGQSGGGGGATQTVPVPAWALCLLAVALAALGAGSRRRHPTAVQHSHLITGGVSKL
jgi:hypothetical protein